MKAKQKRKTDKNISERSYHVDYIHTSALEELIRLCKTL